MKMIHRLTRFMVVAATCLIARAADPGEVAPLSSLDLSKMSSGWGKPMVDRSIENKPLSIGGTKFDHGVGTHAVSILRIRPNSALRFQAWVGVDDETAGKGTVQFKVFGGGGKLFDSGVMTGGDPAKRIDVDLRGAKDLILLATAAGNAIRYAHADWAEAVLVIDGKKPVAINPPRQEQVILTPKPGPAPRINGPRVFGVRPGKPFLYRIPCTGQRPIRFAAVDLPGGLKLDGDTGIIRGRAPKRRGDYGITFKADNPRGSATRGFKLVVGDTLALTPPMGWNSWYIHYDRVNEQHMRQAADAMISSGMANFGYLYVNIDDCWMKKRGDQPYRDPRGLILPNRKFPDMKGMVDHIHALGLRAGIYISPGPWTCAGYVGSYQYEAKDARRFADWGFDFLKYDWCSYGRIYEQRMKTSNDDLAEKKYPYQKMGALLKTLDRDIVLNLCQYGMSDVWKWGGDVGGHCWRTTGDLGLEPGGGMPGFFAIGLANAQHNQYARPGRWNDPDYILIGWVGSAFQMGKGQRTTLTPNEQYAYMSLWSLMAAPLFFSGDMARLDPFTLNVLCNAEVVDIDQDPLGAQGKIIKKTGELLLMAKPLEDGSTAAGLFNISELDQDLSIDFKDLNLTGPRSVRDLWRQKDLGTFSGKFTSKVGRHGVTLVRLRAKR